MNKGSRSHLKGLSTRPQKKSPVPWASSHRCWHRGPYTPFVSSPDLGTSLAALQASDNLSKNNLGNNRGNAQGSEVTPRNHQDALEQVILNERPLFLSDLFCHWLRFLEILPRGYAKERVCHTPVTYDCLILQMQTWDSFITKWVCRFLLLLFSLNSLFLSMHVFFFFFFLSNFAFSHVSWISASYPHPYYHIFFPTAAEWILITQPGTQGPLESDFIHSLFIYSYVHLFFFFHQICTYQASIMSAT